MLETFPLDVLASVLYLYQFSELPTSATLIALIKSTEEAYSDHSSIAKKDELTRA